MNEWYNLYSFWMVILCVLARAKIIKFSVMPTVIFAVFGTIIFLYLKIRSGVPIGATFTAIQIVLHLFPFLILPIKFTRRDVFINGGIFVLYNMWLWAQDKTFPKVYKEIIYEDGRLTLAEYAKKRAIIS
jgi:hypothetical protein